MLLPYINEADIKSEDNYAFRHACGNGHIEVVKLLLPYLSEADIKSEDNYAFTWACVKGHREVARLLVDACSEFEYHPSNKKFQLTPSLPPK